MKSVYLPLIKTTQKVLPLWKYLFSVSSSLIFKLGDYNCENSLRQADFEALDERRAVSWEAVKASV
ncbi:MAG: hypothetical protein FWG82_04405 [Oscillospiraceae bacterium]|nr:hypothetical protein [Oscillospiraceae bacterium]